MYRYQYVVGIVAIIATGALVWHGSLDASVFSSICTLVLGYVFGREVQNVANGNGAK